MSRTKAKFINSLPVLKFRCSVAEYSVLGDMTLRRKVVESWSSCEIWGFNSSCIIIIQKDATFIKLGRIRDTGGDYKWCQPLENKLALNLYMHMAVFRGQLLKLVFAGQTTWTKPTKHEFFKIVSLCQNIVLVKLYCNCRCWASYGNSTILSSFHRVSCTYEYIDSSARGLRCIMPPKGKRAASAKVRHKAENKAI